MKSPYKNPGRKAAWFRIASILTLWAVSLAFTGEVRISLWISIVNAIISTFTYVAFDKFWPLKENGEVQG